MDALASALSHASGTAERYDAAVALKVAWGMHAQIMARAAAGWQVGQAGDAWVAAHAQRGERRAETLDGLLAMVDAPHPIAARRPRGGAHGRG